MDALLLGAVMFASVVPASVPARTPVRFTGVAARAVPGVVAAGRISGRVVTQTSELYTVETRTGELLTFPQPGRTLHGRLVSVDDGVISVLLDDKRPAARVPLASVRDIRISRGRVSAWDRGFLAGLVVGAGIGATYAAGLCGGEIFKCTVAEGAATFGLIGAAVGTSIGVFLKRENWERVESGSFKVAVQPRRGGIGVAVAFGLPRR